ncbi:hypothetical protein V6N13_052981 [Hibiscus sabdariffa]
MSLKQGVVDQPHPLEHSWTFWFDNLQAKSKQATWGSSTRPIYTFSTIEQFWSLTITYTTQASWLWEQTFIVSNIRSSRSGKTLSVLTEASGPERVVLWTKNASDETVQLSELLCYEKRLAIPKPISTSMGKQWKDLLDCNETIRKMQRSSTEVPRTATLNEIL